VVADKIKLITKVMGKASTDIGAEAMDLKGAGTKSL
jgi:hypothetical protein